MRSTELPIEVPRVLLVLDNGDVQTIGTTPDGVPHDVIVHTMQILQLVYDRDRIETVRCVVGGNTVVAMRISAGEHVVTLGLDMMTGHQFMKSLKRWATRWATAYVKTHSLPKERGAA
jgi:hypothetical protein